MKPADSVKSVAVIGNGLMGQGISQVLRGPVSMCP